MQSLAPSTNQTGVSSPRRVLGDVSPNVRKAAQTTHGHPLNLKDNKPVASSPLKRSFTAALENSDHGFKYLKRRKGSFDGRLSNVIAPPASQVPPAEVSTETINTTQQLPPASTKPTQSEQMEPEQKLRRSDSNTRTQAPPDLKSFSSLINYDTPVSSQQSVEGAASRLTRHDPSRSVLADSPSMAEWLQLRLRVAMYKIRTNQIHMSFDELHVEEGHAEYADDDETEADRTEPNSPNEDLPQPESVEDAIARRKREAQLAMPIPDGQKPLPKLTLAPMLVPTAFSSRMI